MFFYLRSSAAHLVLVFLCDLCALCGEIVMNLSGLTGNEPSDYPLSIFAMVEPSTLPPLRITPIRPEG